MGSAVRQRAGARGEGQAGALGRPCLGLDDADRRLHVRHGLLAHVAGAHQVDAGLRRIWVPPAMHSRSGELPSAAHVRSRHRRCPAPVPEACQNWRWSGAAAGVHSSLLPLQHRRSRSSRGWTPPLQVLRAGRQRHRFLALTPGAGRGAQRGHWLAVPEAASAIRHTAATDGQQGKPQRVSAERIQHAQHAAEPALPRGEPAQVRSGQVSAWSGRDWSRAR